MTGEVAAEVKLAPVLDLQQAEPLKAALLALRGQPVVIDASSVERLGGLCLQVLLSAQKTWSRDGQVLTLAPVSDAFTAQWNGFGALPLASQQGASA